MSQEQEIRALARRLVTYAVYLAPLVALMLVFASPAVRADDDDDDNERPRASFVWAPDRPVTGEVVTFTSTSTDPDGRIVAQAWDLDNDGSYDDGRAASVSRSFASAGSKTVRLIVTDDDGDYRAVSKTVAVASNREPAAGFSVSTTTPVTGEEITLTSTSSDPDGRPLKQEWDLDGDGSHDDAAGASAGVSYAGSGPRRITLLVTDSGGISRTASRDIDVRAPAGPPPEDPPPPGEDPQPAQDPPQASSQGPSFPAPIANGPLPPKPALVGPRLMDPFPLVRVRGVTTSRGARVNLLTVRTAGATRIVVRCRGRGCPWARNTSLARFGASRLGAVRIPGFRGRHLGAGTVIEVFVVRKGMIGKYTRFTIRRVKAPARVDRCTAPGVARAQRCPA